MSLNLGIFSGILPAQTSSIASIFAPHSTFFLLRSDQIYSSSCLAALPHSSLEGLRGCSPQDCCHSCLPRRSRTAHLRGWGNGGVVARVSNIDELKQIMILAWDLDWTRGITPNIHITHFALEMECNYIWVCRQQELKATVSDNQVIVV